MPVECKCRERELTVTLSGELDHHGAKQVMANLDSRIDQELPRQLTVDMGGHHLYGQLRNRRAAAGPAPNGAAAGWYVGH